MSHFTNNGMQVGYREHKTSHRPFYKPQDGYLHRGVYCKMDGADLYGSDTHSPKILLLADRFPKVACLLAVWV